MRFEAKSWPLTSNAFKLTKAKWGEFSNFSPHPIIIKGNKFKTSEELYQCLRYPHLPEVQQEIFEAKSPMTAKMIAKKYYPQTVENWMEDSSVFEDGIRVPLMYWCVLQKVKQHKVLFHDLLTEVKGFIVENSAHDPFWGAVPKLISYEGKNVLGIILMNLRNRTCFDDYSLDSLNAPYFNFSMTTQIFGEELEIKI